MESLFTVSYVNLLISTLTTSGIVFMFWLIKGFLTKFRAAELQVLESKMTIDSNNRLILIKLDSLTQNHNQIQLDINTILDYIIDNKSSNPKSCKIVRHTK